MSVTDHGDEGCSYFANSIEPHNTEIFDIDGKRFLQQYENMTASAGNNGACVNSANSLQ